MDINFYHHADGEPWGFWCEGHKTREDAISVFNREIKARDFETISVDQLQHVYAARPEDDDSEYNFYIVEEGTSGAIPITYVDAEKLTPCSDNGSIEKVVDTEVQVLRDAWVAEYAKLLITQCHFDLETAIEMGRAALELNDNDVESCNPSDAVDEEISAMRDCC
ncbi:hypothetical protein KCG43_20295 [Photobacterium sp. WH24]|uniref:hypothetical protein n=1 Tax=Photobacterium sp. WH24 TaxID=2827237 RepID=UPI001C489966|nr:hypothetical protein [Photobacterium sp. WH24]MBV7264355.1 hypothetical protein [Photobacterium sp. WH24]